MTPCTQASVYRDALLVTAANVLGYSEPVARATASTDRYRAASQQAATSEAAVRSELLAVRKRPEGLSPHSMATCPAIVALLGDGDPLLAFTRLETRILARLELDDDVTPLNAVAYSLGLASKGRTHLERLNEFGADYGYEARQARRHSDLGIQQLVSLICSNWIVDAVPVCDVVLVGNPGGGSTEVMVTTKRPRFVDMRSVQIQWYCPDDEIDMKVQDLVPPPRFEPVAPPSSVGRCEDLPGELHVHQRLAEPLMLSPPDSGRTRGLRIAWPGEVWPCFQWQMIGPLLPNATISSQIIGNSIIVMYLPN